MRKHTITDAEALQLLSGATPEGRPELAELAASIADVRRDASQLTAPQPSVALAARLERPTLGGSVSDESVSAKGNTTMAPTRFALAAKIAAAVGVLALGFMGVGAAGALPGPAQDAFDGVVSTIVPTEDDGTDGTDSSTDGSSEGTDGTDGALDECAVDDDGATDGTTDGTAEEEAAEDELYGTTDDGTTDDTTTVDDGTTTDGTVDEGTDSAECEAPLPVGSGEFSDWVKQGARDPNKIGSEFGAAVSEQARELKNEKAEERAANTEGSNGNGAGTAGSNGNGAGNGSGNGNGIGHGNTGAATHDDESSTDNGKPADTPGGRP